MADNNKSTNTAKVLYRNMVIAASMVPFICMCLVTLFALMIIIYVFGGFIVVAFS